MKKMKAQSTVAAAAHAPCHGGAVGMGMGEGEGEGTAASLLAFMPSSACWGDECRRGAEAAAEGAAAAASLPSLPRKKHTSSPAHTPSHTLAASVTSALPSDTPCPSGTRTHAQLHTHTDTHTHTHTHLHAHTESDSAMLLALQAERERLANQMALIDFKQRLLFSRNGGHACHAHTPTPALHPPLHPRTPPLPLSHTRPSGGVDVSPSEGDVDSQDAAASTHGHHLNPPALGGLFPAIYGERHHLNCVVRDTTSIH